MDGGDQARAGRAVKEAEAELDRAEDGNARGRNFCGRVAETAPRYSNGVLREIDRAPKLASYRLRSENQSAGQPIRRGAGAPERRLRKNRRLYPGRK